MNEKDARKIIELQARLLVCYRLRRTPPDKLITDLSDMQAKYGSNYERL